MRHLCWPRSSSSDSCGKTHLPYIKARLFEFADSVCDLEKPSLAVGNTVKLVVAIVIVAAGAVIAIVAI